MGRVGQNRALLCSPAIAVFADMGTVRAQEADVEATEEQVTTENVKKGRVTRLQRLVIGAGQQKAAFDTPQAVSVLEQEDIDSAQPQTVGEALRRIPGVNVSGSERVTGQTFNIRGIGAPESANEEGRIIVTVDGAQKYYEQYRMGGFFSDPELYKKVEVLRGPASSTLYGSGALGGVINFTTKDASDFIADGDTGALRLKGGFNSNRNGWLGSAILAQRLNETAEFLLTGNYRRADSYVSGDGTEIPSSDFAAWSGLAKGTFRVGDEGTLRVSYQQWDSDAEDQDYAQVGTQPTFGTVDRHVIDKTAVVSYENPFSDNDLVDLKVSASFSDTTVDQSDAGNPALGLTCATSTLFCDSRYGYRTWQFNAQNTSEWHGTDWENFLTYGWQTSYQIRSATAVDTSGEPIAYGHHPEGTDFKTGLFVQDEFVWNDRLTLIPGLRLDYRKLTPDGSTTLTSETEDTAFSPKIAALYKLDDMFSIFGSVAHTERFPSLDETFSTPYPSLGLTKEKSNNFEAGFAVSAFDLVQAGDGAQLKTTGFYNDITDMIYRQCSSQSSCDAGGFDRQYVNINEAEIYGFEIEAAYDADHVFANAAYTYTIGRNLTDDSYLTTVAPHELKLTLGGKLPQHDLRFGWNARFVSDPQDAERDGPDATSGRYSSAFDVHDIFVSWMPQDGRMRGWEVHAGIDNLFNRQYKEFLMNDPAKGRTFKLSLARQIGW